jgi:endonuclease/exonuclease/phosphatase family metal-dependent hydrolase
MNTQKLNEPMRLSTWPWIFRARAGAFIPAAGLLLLVITLLASALPAQAGEKCADGKRDLKTMTANLYIGTGTETITALDPTDPNYLMNLVTAVTGVYYELLASQPPLRLQAVADRIAARLPDIVAVEEATLLRVQSPGDLALGGTTPATDVVYDYLQILVNSLKARGAHYVIVSTSQEWDVEMPMLHLGPDGQPTVVLGPDGQPTYLIDDVRQTDREAILVRTDLPPGQLRVSHPQSGNYVKMLVQGFPVTRGWCSVDVSLRGEDFRYICTHLEEETSPDIQVAQTKELLAGPVKTHLPIVLVGDFNSDPLHRDRPKGQPTAYPRILAAGFCDTWALLHPFHLAGGLTWGHDEFLADPSVSFDRRIDFVFFRGSDFSPVKAEPIDLSLGRTEPPLWASDHAALAAELRVK